MRKEKREDETFISISNNEMVDFLYLKENAAIDYAVYDECDDYFDFGYMSNGKHLVCRVDYTDMVEKLGLKKNFNDEIDIDCKTDGTVVFSFYAD